MGAQLQTWCQHWENWGSWSAACSSMTQMWGAGKRAKDFPSAPRMQTGMKTPWRCLMEPQPWLGRDREVRQAGAGTQDTKPRQCMNTCPSCCPWGHSALGNGVPPGLAQHTNRQRLQEGLWGQTGDQAETQQNSLCKKSPISQAAGPCPTVPPARPARCGKHMPG